MGLNLCLITTFSLLFITTGFGNCKPAVLQTLEEYKSTIRYTEIRTTSPQKHQSNPVNSVQVSCQAKPPVVTDGTQSAAIADGKYRWEALFFHIDDDFDGNTKADITDALSEIRRHSCIDMNLLFSRDAAGVRDHIFIEKGEKNSGCYSHVGKQGGEQIVNLGPGCETKDIIIHEIMHALGYWHEQSRPDRDDFVTIQTEYIQQRELHNFDKQPTSLTFRLPYDQTSIMHYGPKAFSISNKHDTIVAKNGKPVGNNGELTETDIEKLKIITGCDTSGKESWHDGASGAKWNFNCDFFGNDLESFKNTRGEDCGTLCSQKEGCARFTWRTPDGGTCWLKDGGGDSDPVRETNPDGVCGYIERTWNDGEMGSKWRKNCDFYGDDIASSTNTKSEHCGDLCSQQKSCVRFTWRIQDGGTCWLKNGSGSDTPRVGDNPDGVCGFIDRG